MNIKPLVVDLSKKIWEQMSPESWHQGSSSKHIDDELISLCAVGWQAHRYLYTYPKQTHELCVQRFGCSLSTYNDRPETKFEDIYNLFKELDL